MKTANEITVRADLPREELLQELAQLGFTQTDATHLTDIYYLPADAPTASPREALRRAVLIRSLDGAKHFLVFKRKTFGPDGAILSQDQARVEVASPADAAEFLEAAGLRRAMVVEDDMVVWAKGPLSLCVQAVNGRHLFIEVEENSVLSTVPRLIAALEASGVPYDRSDYFIKKAEIILRETIR